MKSTAYINWCIALVTLTGVVNAVNLSSQSNQSMTGCLEPHRGAPHRGEDDPPHWREVELLSSLRHYTSISSVSEKAHYQRKVVDRCQL